MKSIAIVVCAVALLVAGLWAASDSVNSNTSNEVTQKAVQTGATCSSSCSIAILWADGTSRRYAAFPTGHDL